MTESNLLEHIQLMSYLSGLHKPLLDLIKGANVHYLDVPMYGNIGDLLIMQGTQRFFQDNNVNISRAGMYFNYSPRNLPKDNSVIVFQGGGSLGDIYPVFQNFRETIIDSAHASRVIILPQSIKFIDAENYKASCRLLARHPDLHICVRDRRSYELAMGMTNNVYLMPDMAHQLWPIPKKVNPLRDVLYLKRRDSEARGQFPYSKDHEYFDWVDLVGSKTSFFLSNFVERGIYHANRIGLNDPFAGVEYRVWSRYANFLTSKAIDLFASHREICSDRLHAHILASLMSIPSSIVDNSYGKNSGYISEWTAKSSLVNLI